MKMAYVAVVNQIFNVSNAVNASYSLFVDLVLLRKVEMEEYNSIILCF